MFKINKGKSMRNKLFTSYIVFTFMVLMFTSLPMIFITEKIIEKEVGRSRLQSLAHVSGSIENVLKEIINASNLIYYDEKIREALISPISNDMYEQYAENERINEDLSKYSNILKTGGFRFYSELYGFNGKEFGTTKEIDQLKKKWWFNEVLNKDGGIFWTSYPNNIETFPVYSHVLSCARLLKENYTNNPLGILVININIELLYDTCKDVLDQNNSLYIIDEKGYILFHKNYDYLGLKVTDIPYNEELVQSNDNANAIIKREDEKLLVSISKVKDVNWKLVEEIPVKSLVSPLNIIKFAYFLIIAICLTFGLLISYAVSNKVSSPIKYLYGKMKEVINGKLDIEIEIDERDLEMKTLGNGFKSMLERIKILIEEVRLQEQKKREAELSFLQAQINPHFLYNTLYSIKCTIGMGQNAVAENMMMAFMRLLKKVFETGSEFVTISEEIDCLRDYILIQQMKYPEKFETMFEIDPVIYSYRIPKLILQPLVENAIFHGIEPKEGKGIIVVRGLEYNNNLYMKIMDNGVGMPEGISINEIAKLDQNARHFNRVGMGNVDERIKLNFGNDYGVAFSSEKNKGTTIEVKMPIIS